MGLVSHTVPTNQGDQASPGGRERERERRGDHMNVTNKILLLDDRLEAGTIKTVVEEHY